MGGYARYVPSSEGNNVVHLDGADAPVGPDGLDDVQDRPQTPRQNKRGVFVTWHAAAVVAVLTVCVVVLVALVIYFSVAARACADPARASEAPGPTPPTEPPTPAPATGLRLPVDIRPLHYQLTLAPFIYSNNESSFYFTGSLNITVIAVNDTDVILLHADRIPLTESVVRVVSTETGSVWQVRSIEYSQPSQWYVLTLANPLQAGRSYRIEVTDFRKPLLKDLRGLYYSVYSDAGQTKYLVVSQLQPTDARKTIPCFDEPAFKARFEVTLVRRSDFQAVSNMPSRSVRPVQNLSRWLPNADTRETWVEEQFETSPLMSTYLLAFIVSQFKYLEGTDSRGRLYRNWARPELVNTTGYAMTAVTSTIQFFEAYFDVPFPLNKTDQAALPDFVAGGMENWGLITYRESRLLFDPLKDTIYSLQHIGNVITHEVAHMWFGNLVTPQWWDDLWLNEGFATFTQILGIQQMHPDWDIDAQFVVDAQMIAFHADAKSSSRPIYTEVQNPNQIAEIFDAITYRKGAAVLRMVYYFLGDKVFRRAIGAYLKLNSYASTFHTSLYNSLTAEAQANGRTELNVTEIMDPWIKQMGYPVLTCTREAGSIRLSQSRFLSDSGQSLEAAKLRNDYNYTWILPITMATKANATSAASKSDISGLVQWLRVKSQAFDSGPPGTGWFLINLRSAGFYRVNYDSENWRALTDQLQTNHEAFAPQDRARLLDDSFSLAAAGRIDYSVPLNMTRYLRNETHYVPWRAALFKLSLLHSMLHRSSAVYGPFSSHMRNLLEPVYASLGITASREDPHMRRLLRALIVRFACQFGVPACRRDASRLFDTFAAGGFVGDLPPDVRQAVLCEGITAGSEDFWNSLYRRGRNDPHPGVQSDILRALSCTSQPWLLNRYLNYALDDQMIRRQDVAAVFSGVSSNPNGLQIVWDYLRDNWNLMIERVPSAFSPSSCISLLGEFNTKQRLEEMLEFKTRYRDKLASVERAMNQALESVKINILWMDTNLEVVKVWLTQYASVK